jgi:hypothetical protein
MKFLKTSNKIRSIICISSLFFFTSFSQAQTLTATEIMHAVDARYTGDTQLWNSTLVLIDNKERERVRSLRLYTINKDDVDKTVMFFLAPTDVYGTAYMTFDWEDKNKEDDSWLYLPALEKIKRVASSEESGAFMGSDFSYADINGLDVDDYDYVIKNASELVDGHDCWVLESTPKTRAVIDKTGYTHSTLWIRKDNFFNVQSIINVEKGKRVKYFSAKDVKEIQGVWTPMVMQMVTTRNGKREHSSVFKLTEVRYNEAVSESLFDTQALQRGVP